MDYNIFYNFNGPNDKDEESHADWADEDMSD